MLEVIKERRSHILPDFTSELLKEVDGRFIYLVQEKKSNKKYIVKFLGADKKEELKKSVEVSNCLYEHGFIYLPHVMAADDGSLYVDHQEGTFYVSEYIEWEHPMGSEETFAAFGKLLAQLHNIPTDWLTHYSTRSPEQQMSKLLANGKEYKLSESYFAMVKKLPDFSDLPKAIIHTDLHVANAIENEKGEMFFIDCDALAIGTRILDLGFFIAQQFLNHDLEFNEKRAHAFFHSYEEHVEKKLTDIEKKYMVDAGLFYSLYIVICDNTELRMKGAERVDAHRDMLCESIFSS